MRATERKKEEEDRPTKKRGEGGQEGRGTSAEEDNQGTMRDESSTREGDDQSGSDGAPNRGAAEAPSQSRTAAVTASRRRASMRWSVQIMSARSSAPRSVSRAAQVGGRTHPAKQHRGASWGATGGQGAAKVPEHVGGWGRGERSACRGTPQCRQTRSDKSSSLWLLGKGQVERRSIACPRLEVLTLKR